MARARRRRAVAAGAAVGATGGGAGVGRVADGRRRTRSRRGARRWRSRCLGSAGSLEGTGSRPHRGTRIARPGSTARRQQALGRRGAWTRGPAPSPDPAHPTACRRDLASPERHPAQGDVERPQEQGQDQQQRPQLGEPVRGGQVMAPRVERCRHDRPAGRGPQRRQERLVGTQLAVLGRGRGDQPDRSPEWRRPRPRLRHPHRIRARLDLAERRFVDARARPGRG